MREFMMEVMLASHKALRLFEAQEQRQKRMGFWSSLFCSGESASEEYTLEDRRRVASLLNNSIDQMAAMYQVCFG